MRLKEFLGIYCIDILNKEKELQELGTEFRDYDVIDWDEETGRPILYISVGSLLIKRDDILDMDDSEFKAQYPSKEALNVRNEYLSHYDIKQGFEAVFSHLEKARKEAEEIQQSYEARKEYFSDSRSSIDKYNFDEW